MKEIENARITEADLSMADHGCFTLALTLQGDGWAVVFGGRCLGKGYLGAEKFEGSSKGIEEIMRIMDVVGVDKFSQLEGKYIRVDISDGWGATITKIGNIIEDKWFDYKEFYNKGGA